MMKIRKAVPADIPAIVELEERCFSLPWSEASFMSELLSPDVYFPVAEEDGALIGFAVLHRLGDDGEVFNVAVRPESRRRGVGKALIDQVLEGAKELGTPHLYLEVRRSNEGAQALYASAGFTLCGVRKNYYEAPVEDALIMEYLFPGEELQL